jgi:hypothetical protein
MFDTPFATYGSVLAVEVQLPSLLNLAPPLPQLCSHGDGASITQAQPTGIAQVELGQLPEGGPNIPPTR